eukprot:SM000054S18076  [mRNA]  locus=s54:270545:271851:- [translate_table: standard]
MKLVAALLAVLALAGAAAAQSPMQVLRDQLMISMKVVKSPARKSHAKHSPPPPYFYRFPPYHTPPPIKQGKCPYTDAQVKPFVDFIIKYCTKQATLLTKCCPVLNAPSPPPKRGAPPAVSQANALACLNLPSIQNIIKLQLSGQIKILNCPKRRLPKHL